MSNNLSGGFTITGGNGWQPVGVVGGVVSTINLTGPSPSIKIDDGEIDLRELLFLMREMKERLLILEEKMAMHDEYPALKNIYDQYKVVEALVKHDR